MKIKLFILSVLFVPATALAINQQIPTDRKIIEIHTYSSGASLVYSPSSADGLGCTGTGANKTVHIRWSTDPDMKAMYSSALTAYSAGKTVGFGVNGCASGFSGEIPLLYRIDVKD